MFIFIKQKKNQLMKCSSVYSEPSVHSVKLSHWYIGICYVQWWTAYSTPVLETLYTVDIKYAPVGIG